LAELVEAGPVLSTGRVLEHWHTGSMTRRASVLDQLEPEAVAFMSPKDTRRMKVSPGDLVRLETRRGAAEIKVRSDRDVPENMVFMPFCCAEAAANLLPIRRSIRSARFPNSSSAPCGPSAPRSAPRRCEWEGVAKPKP
jgi:predicted molibdopterin-dependent oxidoreductase YjgC